MNNTLDKNRELNIASYDAAAADFDAKIATLPNYTETYNALAELLPSDAEVLDLACGPGNISRTLIKKAAERKIQLPKITGIDLADSMLEIAKKYIPDGVFLNQSIIDFKLPQNDKKFDIVINGFGLPYLTNDEAAKSIAHSVEYLKKDGIFYVSFMNGDFSRLETPSFNTNVKLMVYYHLESEVEKYLVQCGLKILNRWSLPYTEADGSITKDIVFIAQKN